MKQTAGTRSKQLTEMIDVLPTLLELGGVPMPTNETYDGVSLVPLVEGTVTTTGKNMSFSQYCKLQSKLTLVPKFSIDNAQRMENCP